MFDPVRDDRLMIKSAWPISFSFHSNVRPSLSPECTGSSYVLFLSLSPLLSRSTPVLTNKRSGTLAESQDYRGSLSSPSSATVNFLCRHSGC